MGKTVADKRRGGNMKRPFHVGGVRRGREGATNGPAGEPAS